MDFSKRNHVHFKTSLGLKIPKMKKMGQINEQYATIIRDHLLKSTIPTDKNDQYSFKIRPLWEIQSLAGVAQYVPQKSIKYQMLKKYKTQADLPLVQFQVQLNQREDLPNDLHFTRMVVSRKKLDHNTAVALHFVKERSQNSSKSKDELKSSLLKQNKDEEDLSMKAGIKYLRMLGLERRGGGSQALPQIEEECHQDEDKRKSTIHAAITPHLLSPQKDWSLSDLRNTSSPINLNSEEQEYIEFTKEYRNFDENKFKAFKKSINEQRRRSLQAEQTKTGIMSVSSHDSSKDEQSKLFEIKLHQVRHCQSFSKLERVMEKEEWEQGEIRELINNDSNQYFIIKQINKDISEVRDIQRTQDKNTDISIESKKKGPKAESIQSFKCSEQCSDEQCINLEFTDPSQSNPFQQQKIELINNQQRNRKQTPQVKWQYPVETVVAKKSKFKDCAQKKESPKSIKVPQQVPLKQFPIASNLKSFKQSLKELSNNTPCNKRFAPSLNPSPHASNKFFFSTLQGTFDLDKNHFSSSKISSPKNRTTLFQSPLKHETLKQMKLNLISLVNDLDLLPNSVGLQKDLQSSGARMMSRCASERKNLNVPLEQQPELGGRKQSYNFSQVKDTGKCLSKFSRPKQPIRDSLIAPPQQGSNFNIVLKEIDGGHENVDISNPIVRK